MRRLALVSLAALLLTGCPKPAKTQEPTANGSASSGGTGDGGSVANPKPTPAPEAPSEPERRIKNFNAVSSSRSAKDHPSDFLFDNDLSTAWISRANADGPMSVDLVLPAPGADGMCVRKIGLLGGVFGSDGLSAKVARPAKIKVVYSLVPKKSAKKSTGALPKNEAEVTLSAASPGSTEIQWFELPEVCQVARVSVHFEVGDPAEIPDIAISELYVLAE